MSRRRPSRTEVSAALTQAGVAHDPAGLTLNLRDGRLAVRLPGDRMAWFPYSAAGGRRLARERRVLRLLEAHCGFRAPRVLQEDAEGWDLRALVPGLVDPVAFYGRLTSDPAYAFETGRQIGAILAEQHAVPRDALEGWLPTRPGWPRRGDIRRLPQVVDDPDLLARVGEAFARRRRPYRDAPVLTHGDLGPHNLAIDPASEAVAGVFDYDGAGFGDRHEDFKYLLFDRGGDAMLEGAIAAYEPRTGVKVDRDRVRLLNALAAIGFLGFRYGHPPEEAWCGRTLAEDLAWTETALRRAAL